MQNKFVMRFGIGIILPVVVEIAVFQSYLWFKTARLDLGLAGILDLGIAFPLALFAIPLMLLYVIAPHLIYNFSLAGREYEKNLVDHLDEIFQVDIGSDVEGPVLSTSDKERIREQIISRLIPVLKREFKREYTDTYFTREPGKEQDVLTYHETMFLLTGLLFLINTMNTVGVILLHFGDLTLDFFYIDQISNPVNVLIFASLFASLSIVSLVLVRYSLRKIRHTIPRALPRVVFWEDQLEREERGARVDALKEFDFRSVFNPAALENEEFMKTVYDQTIAEPLREAIDQHSRSRIAKELTWRQYQKILADMDLEPQKIETIEAAFFISPELLSAARRLSFDEKEFRGLKLDMERAKTSADNWDVLTPDQHVSSFLFLYRSAETLFRNLLRELGIFSQEGGFPATLDTLRDKGFILQTELRQLDRFRRKRNILLHKSGASLEVSKAEMQQFVSLFEGVLARTERRYWGKSGGVEPSAQQSAVSPH